MPPTNAPTLTDDSSCPKCADQSHPFKCFICEHPGSLEAYRATGTIEEICSLVVGIKLCNKHAIELDELQQKREIERAAA